MYVYIGIGIMRMERQRLCFAVGVAQFLWACNFTIHDFPNIEISVEQSERHVIFEFYRVEKRLWSKARWSQPVSYFSLHLPGGYLTLWEVTLIQGKSGVSRIVYGELPPEFKQIKPESGDPPPLEHTREYSVSASSDLDGEKLGAASFVFRGS